MDPTDEDDDSVTSVAPSMAVVSEAETMEFFNEGLKQAVSAARDLANAQKHPIWMDISLLCEEMRRRGVELSRMKPMSRFDKLVMVDDREKKLCEDQEKPSKLWIN